MDRLKDSKFLRYFVFGAMAAALQVATLTIFVEIVGLEKVSASVAAFCLAVIVNYFLQRRYTFRSSERHWIAMPKFIAVSTVGVGINTLMFFLLTKFMHYIIAQCACLVIVFLFNYCVSRSMVFRQQDDLRVLGRG